jgi:hypothetical protein
MAYWIIDSIYLAGYGQMDIYNRTICPIIVPHLWMTTHARPHLYHDKLLGKQAGKQALANARK